MSTPGQRLREIRKSLKLTQVDFGKLVGISGAYICQMEKGMYPPNVTVCDALAAMGFSQLWLFRGEGEMGTPTQRVAPSPKPAPDPNEQDIAALMQRLQITRPVAELLAQRRANDALHALLTDHPLTVRECIGVIAGLNRARQQHQENG